jgi:DNA-binding NtrC family response regulator
MPRRRGTLLVVDDDPVVVEWLEEELEAAGYAVHGLTSGKEALARISTCNYDLVICDVVMPGVREPELLAAIVRYGSSRPVVLISGFGTIELAVKYVHAGACDFLAKPFPIEALLRAIERALAEWPLHPETLEFQERLEPVARDPIVARSRPMKQVLALAEKASKVTCPVLITGEGGVGKSTVARVMHDLSAHRKGPFLELNCAALSSRDAEVELLGARHGADLEGQTRRPRLLEQARGGTLFLDELAELDLEAQPQLLHALDRGRPRPVDGTREHALAARVIAATSTPLEDALRRGRFRPSLYHRINVIRIDVPPLRERLEDLEALIEVFFRRATARVGRVPAGISRPAMGWLRSQPWLGNARELANVIERAVALSDHDTLVTEDFESAMDAEERRLFYWAASRDMTLEQLQTEYLKRVLRKTRGNKTRAAQILGLDRRTVYRKVSELGLEADSR